MALTFNDLQLENSQSASDISMNKHHLQTLPRSNANIIPHQFLDAWHYTSGITQCSNYGPLVCFGIMNKRWKESITRTHTSFVFAIALTRIISWRCCGYCWRNKGCHGRRLYWGIKNRALYGGKGSVEAPTSGWFARSPPRSARIGRGLVDLITRSARAKHPSSECR